MARIVEPITTTVEYRTTTARHIHHTLAAGTCRPTSWAGPVTACHGKLGTVKQLQCDPQLFGGVTARAVSGIGVCPWCVKAGEGLMQCEPGFEQELVMQRQQIGLRVASGHHGDTSFEIGVC